MRTEKLGSWDRQMSVEAAHTYARESEQLHNSSNIWPSKILGNQETEQEQTIKLGNLHGTTEGSVVTLQSLTPNDVRTNCKNPVWNSSLVSTCP